MSERFKELTLGLIDEGNLYKQAEIEFADLQHQLIGFVNKHGEVSEGTKAKLTISLEVKVVKAKDKVFTCSSSIKKALPNPPAVHTMVLGGESQTEKMSLFCRKTGSTADSPQQSILATEDGKTVDHGTGEIKP